MQKGSKGHMLTNKYSINVCLPKSFYLDEKNDWCSSENGQLVALEHFGGAAFSQMRHFGCYDLEYPQQLRVTSISFRRILLNIKMQ